MTKVKEESEKVGLKLDIQKTKIMASHHFTANRRGNNADSETYFGGLQNHCSHKIKKTLAPWKKSYDQPRLHIKKQRHYFATKVCLVKALVFPVVMYGCESWTIEKAEHQRIDAFELWFW